LTTLSTTGSAVFGAGVITGIEKLVQSYGSQFDDVLYGGDGNDTLQSQGGLDKLYGGNGDDRLEVSKDGALVDGGAGIDTLFIDFFGGSAGLVTTLSTIATRGTGKVYGEAGSDMLYGGADADKLYGGTESNQLFGGQGTDTLQGDAGADTLSGGDALKDTFAYVAMGDSGVGVGNRDSITDFDAADVISFKAIDADASVIGDQAFAFIGTAAFAVQALSQVRYQVVGSDTIIQVENTGDGVVDMEIKLTGYTTAINAHDFIL